MNSVNMFAKIGLCIIIIAAQSTALNLFPLHASCEITWKWPQTQCSYVQNSLQAQISKWNLTAPCETGEKCGYHLKSQTKKALKATHTTPKKHYVDDLTFNFSDDGNCCIVTGKSSSETWYAVLDYGTNYCNLHNLITGSELDKQPQYSEETSDSVCTQYSSADCEKY